MPLFNRLTGPNLFDPMWFNSVRHGTHDASVSLDGTISLNGEALHFRDRVLPAGTMVRVWLSASGFWTFATLADIENEAQARAKREADAAEAERQRRNKLRLEAIDFNSRIALPVRWDVGIKDALSGLSQDSFGDGRNRSTVEHIYLLAPLQAGRLARKAGDFLCTAASGSNGKRWSSKVIERSHDGAGLPYQPKVSCKACLAAAERWIAAGRRAEGVK